MLSVASRAIRTTEPNRPATVSDSIPSHHRGGRAIRPTGTNIPQTPGGCNRGQPGEHPPPEDWSIRQTRVGVTGPEQGHPAGPGRAAAGPAASIRPARGTGGPPSQGRQPVRHIGETFVRPGRATTTSGRTSQGTGHPPYGGKTSDKPGERPPDPRASIQARVWAITGWAAGPPDFGPKASRQCWGAVRRDGVVAGVLVQFTFGGIPALRSGNLVYLGHALGIVGRYNMLAALAECWLTSSRFNGRKPAMMPPSTRWLRLTASVSWAQSPV